MFFATKAENFTNKFTTRVWNKLFSGLCEYTINLFFNVVNNWIKANKFILDYYVQILTCYIYKV